MSALRSRAAAVVIGLNEGPRLRRCLGSVLPRFAPVIYVDSASADDSAEIARALGAEVIDVVPFSFGRGHNAGVDRACALAPGIEFVQFVDADSELTPGWCADAVEAMDGSPRLAAVHGRVRERHPSRTIYHRLYDLEFDPRVRRPRNNMGGIALVRVSALQQVGGYVEGMSGFEDHELCSRLAQFGWEARWLDAEMAVHEAGMTRWHQWLRRERRAGRGYAELVSIRGWSTGTWWRDLASVCLWGGLLPALILVGVSAWPRVALFASLAYPTLFFRIYWRQRQVGLSRSDSALYAGGRVVGKVPQFAGVVAHVVERMRTPRWDQKR